MKTRILAIAAITLLSACAKPAMQTERTSNPNISTELMFNQNGYLVYRFYDGGRAHYFVIPEGTVTSTHTENCGKNCTRTVTEEVPTVRTVL